MIALARADADDRLRTDGVGEVIDCSADWVPDVLQRTHPEGVAVLIDVASDADGFAALDGDPGPLGLELLELRRRPPW